ncbi:MAG: HpaII family restriction endonuclease [Bacteroidia bacterium]
MTSHVKQNVTHLKRLELAEYHLEYFVCKGWIPKSVEQIHSKYILLFKKFKYEIQQYNLHYIDTIFPNIFADLVQEVLVNKVSSFSEYLSRPKSIIIINPERDIHYFRYKIDSFADFLLFSTISSRKKFNSEMIQGKVYYFKSHTNEVSFYSIYTLSLEEKNEVYKQIKLKIDLSKSTIINRKATVCLKIFID